MIIRSEYSKTPEHAKEMVACAKMIATDKTWQKETLDTYETLDQFYKGYFSVPIGNEFAEAMQSINNGPPLRILDVGAGRGETSLYLVNHGHHVFPVEPSYEFCEVIEYVGERFGKYLTIYNCSAEDLNIPEAQFDLVVFNASLHHCDDPTQALRNVYRFLRLGGKLLLINEPMLPFFKTEERFLKSLAMSPDESGDYGGNEHNYHYSEYRSMMKAAGYQNVRAEIAARYRSKVGVLESMRADLRPPGTRKKIKSFYLNFVHISTSPALTPLLGILERLSLVQLNFSATK
jgi:ubiquinone/menaquinone biosynthesis C-methylase UbiE